MRNHPVATIVCLGLVLIAIAAGIVWYLHARHYESSDDAFIDTRPVLVSPQVTGTITAVAVTDNQVVKRGDLTATLARILTLLREPVIVPAVAARPA